MDHTLEGKFPVPVFRRAPEHIPEGPGGLSTT